MRHLIVFALVAPIAMVALSPLSVRAQQAAPAPVAATPAPTSVAITDPGEQEALRGLWGIVTQRNAMVARLTDQLSKATAARDKAVLGHATYAKALWASHKGTGSPTTWGTDVKVDPKTGDVTVTLAGQ